MPIIRWDDVVLNNCGLWDWRENFRISTAMFDYLCQNLRPLNEKAIASIKRPAFEDRRDAITLCILATPEYRGVSHLFSLACCKVCLIVHETCKAIIQKFKSMYISFPTGNNLETVIQGFHSKWNIVQVLLMVHTYPLQHLR